MSKQPHPFDSTEQRSAEIEVLALLNKQLKLKFISKPVIVNKTLFQLGGYSEKPPVLYEILTHRQIKTGTEKQDQQRYT